MDIRISVVLPCLNERETIATCIKKSLQTLEKMEISSEVVVADNGSTDGSVEIATSLGARVVHEKRMGYGNAYRAGIAAAKGKYIVIADSDDSYDLTDLERFVKPLEDGADMVMGTRMRGRIEKGAMPWHHRYIGNPVLTGILNLMFHARVSDAHCGMRSFTKDAYEKMELQTTGMEFASEMVIKAAQLGLNIKEIPITLYRDGRNRPPHLRSFRDGWRHLRFMLLHSQTHLFFIPGFTLLLLGMAVLIGLLPGPITIAHMVFDRMVMVIASMLAILGFQIINIGAFAKIYAVTHFFSPHTANVKRAFKLFNLERGLLVGTMTSVVGFGGILYCFIKWLGGYHGRIDLLRIAIFFSTFMIIGAQAIFSSFFLSMLGIERRPNKKMEMM